MIPSRWHTLQLHIDVRMTSTIAQRFGGCFYMTQDESDSQVEVARSPCKGFIYIMAMGACSHSGKHSSDIIDDMSQIRTLGINMDWQALSQHGSCFVRARGYLLKARISINLSPILQNCQGSSALPWLDHLIDGKGCAAVSDSLCSFNRFSYHGLRNFRNARHSCDRTHDFVCLKSDATSVTVRGIPSLIPYRRQRTLRSSSPSFCVKQL